MGFQFNSPKLQLLDRTAGVRERQKKTVLSVIGSTRRQKSATPPIVLLWVQAHPTLAAAAASAAGFGALGLARALIHKGIA